MSDLRKDQLDYVRQIVYERSGISLGDRKDYLFQSRLAALARSLHLDNSEALVAKMREPASEELRGLVVEAMTTNETSFFRDGHPFDALRAEVLPSLLAARMETRTLDIWCAASSTGQEPYTLAMLLLETVPQVASWRIRILATDLSEYVLERARAGVYSDVEVGRGLPDALRSRYFEAHEGCWRVRADVRAMVEYRQLNLNAPWPVLPRMDLVFVRNVLIYFDMESKRSILQRVRKVLAPDGLLCLGTAETVIGICDEYERVCMGKATYFRPRSAVPDEVSR